MEFDDIKEKIVGWVTEKEGLGIKDRYFLFKDMANDSWEEIKGESEEEEFENGIDPDSLEAFGEETKADAPELPLEEDGDDEEFDEPLEIPALEEEGPAVETVKKDLPIFANKPRVKST